MSGNLDPSLVDLFRQEVEQQGEEISKHLLEWEKSIEDISKIEPLMRAAHSMKGAARIVGLSRFSDLAHILEDCFVAAQNEELRSTSEDVDVYLSALDFLQEVKGLQIDALQDWPGENSETYDSHTQALSSILARKGKEPKTSDEPKTEKSETKEKKEENDKPEEMTTSDSAMDALFDSQFSSHVEKLEAALSDKESYDNEDTLKETLKLLFHSLREICSIANKQDKIAELGVVEEKVVTLFAEGKLKEKAPEIVNAIKGLKQRSEHVARKIEPKRKIELPESVEEEMEERQHPKESKSKIKKRQVVIAKGQKPFSKAAVSHNLQTKTLDDREKDKSVRVSSQNLTRLMGLAAESMVETQRLGPIKSGILQLKLLHNQMSDYLEMGLGKELTGPTLATLEAQINSNERKYRRTVANLINTFEDFYRKNSTLSSKLYSEVLQSRMRPFSDGVASFPRIVRSLARSLNKKINFEMDGGDTPVDRDILEKLEAPLNHIIRNACDHGIESPDERKAADKDPQGTIRIQARHNSGMLLVSISDDGKGIDKEKLRNDVLERGHVTAEMAQTLSDEELFEFLFLPGFSTTEEVTDISGRGVGLDVVLSMMQEIGGTVTVNSNHGEGTQFEMRLPITRSVMRALMVEIDGEAYAFPLSKINHTLTIERNQISTLENHDYFHFEDKNVAVVSLDIVLALNSKKREYRRDVPMVVVGEKDNIYGMRVDKFIGETELVVRKLDFRLGKVPCVSSASLDNEGNPVLILDVEDIVKITERLLGGQDISTVLRQQDKHETREKKILVVDDSLTVRETERQILLGAGYEVDVAVDGMDGWNMLRNGKYDLVVTDIDMPRMNGLEFLEHIRGDGNFQQLPVIIVSYKDREEDRNKGMELGANAYLTKGSFQDESFINAVKELIGDS